MREISLHILDIITNSIEAGATRVILVIEESKDQNLLKIRIRDNGRGMSPELLKKVLDPFVTTRTTRSVGMGLSLYKFAAEQSKGQFEIKSELGKGTLVTAEFQLNNFNRAPLGNIAESVVNLIIGAIDVHLVYINKSDEGVFTFDSYWLLARMAERDCSLYEMVKPAITSINKLLNKINSTA